MRVRPVRQFLCEGRPVAVRVARGVRREVAVPVELVSVGHAVAIRVLRGGHVVRRQRRVLVEHETRRVIGPPPGVTGGEVLLRRNRPVGEDVAVFRGRGNGRVGASRLQRRLGDSRHRSARRGLVRDVHDIGPSRRSAQEYCALRKQNSDFSFHLKPPFSERSNTERPAAGRREATGSFAHDCLFSRASLSLGSLCLTLFPTLISVPPSLRVRHSPTLAAPKRFLYNNAV